MEDTVNVNEDVKVEGGATGAGVETVEGKEERLYTQEELQAKIDEVVSKRVARETKKLEKANEEKYQAQLKAELEESEKLAKMNEADREKAKADKERKQFEADRAKYLEERKQFEQTKIKTQTMEMLSERNIPVELAQFVNSSNADEIMENVTLFKEHFDKAVQKVVAERMRGTVPISSGSTKSNEDDFLKGFKQKY